MEGWKKVFVRAAGFGAGAILVIVPLAAGLYWWSERPAKPKPWSQNAITANYESLDTEGEKNTLYFAYTLTNHTDTDFTISNDSFVHLGISMRRYQNAFSFDSNKMLTADYPIYVPAKKSVRLRIHVAYPYPEADDTNASDDVRHDYGTKLAAFVAKELNNLNGFVLMDENTRYQIDMPNGWDERAKEPLRVKNEPAARN